MPREASGQQTPESESRQADPTEFLILDLAITLIFAKWLIWDIYRYRNWSFASLAPPYIRRTEQLWTAPKCPAPLPRKYLSDLPIQRIPWRIPGQQTCSGISSVPEAYNIVTQLISVKSVSCAD
ncbi:hypothetical protein BBP40_009162 [Aspergillus hancockii]|nr:hypothetical protein BBP40_009162 [Aspergillus hancockii]